MSKKAREDTILIASRKNDVITIKRLLQKGISPDQCARSKITPLMEAASRGFEESVDVLLKHGADVNALSTKRESAVAYAAANGHASILRKLLDRGGQANSWIRLFWERASGLTISAGRGDVTIVRMLLEAGANPNGVDEPERPIVLAARNKHVEVVHLLLKNGADVNAKSHTGSTPLIAFSANGCMEGIRLLLDHKPDVNAQNSDGMTALMWACRNGHLEIAQLLIQSGADLTIRDTFRQRFGIRDNVLTWAIAQKQVRVVKWLLARKKKYFDSKDLKQANAFLKGET